MSQRLRFDTSVMQPVTNFASHGASSVHLGSGSGETHTYALHFEAGGEIGEHETGFGQLFVVTSGSGWVTCESSHYDVAVGDAIFLPRGVEHSKGSESGMTALMVQVFDLEPGEARSVDGGGRSG